MGARKLGNVNVILPRRVMDTGIIKLEKWISKLPLFEKSYTFRQCCINSKFSTALRVTGYPVISCTVCSKKTQRFFFYTILSFLFRCAHRSRVAGCDGLSFTVWSCDTASSYPKRAMNVWWPRSQSKKKENQQNKKIFSTALTVNVCLNLLGF